MKNKKIFPGNSLSTERQESSFAKKTKTKVKSKAGKKVSARSGKIAVKKPLLKNEKLFEKAKNEKETVAAGEEENFLVLETSDHVQSEEERAFFYLGIAVSTVMTIVFGWQRNFTAALVFVMMLVVIFMFLARKPGKVVLKLDREYFWINDGKYNVFNLEHFWFTEQYGVKYLNVKIKKSIIPVLSIALGESDINEIRKAFLNFIPEISPEEIESGALDKYLGTKDDKSNNSQSG